MFYYLLLVLVPERLGTDQGPDHVEELERLRVQLEQQLGTWTHPNLGSQKEV